MHWLIAYDIAHPKRLRRVARVMERHAIRVQKSVFVFEGSRRAAEQLLSNLEPLIVETCDVVQAWPLVARGQPLARGTAHPQDPQCVVVTAEDWYYTERGFSQTQDSRTPGTNI